MEQDGGWPSLGFDRDLMMPGDHNLGGQSMDILSDLDDPLSPLTDHNVSINAPRQTLGFEPAGAPSGSTISDSSYVSTHYTDSTKYTAFSAGESSGQHHHKPHQDGPHVDLSQFQDNSLAFVGYVSSDPPRPTDLPLDLGSNDAIAEEPTIEGGNIEVTILIPSASIHPESDSRRTTTSVNLPVLSQGAQSTADDDPLREVVMQMLGQSPTRQRLSQVRRDLGGICTDLDELLTAQERVERMQMPPPPRSPSVRESKPKQRSKPQVAYRCLTCGVPGATRQVFKRHVETKHQAQYDYHCHICTANSKKPQHRRDKLLDHYDRAHNLDTPSESIIEANRVEHRCPLICLLCRELVDDWDGFYDCFINHCEVKHASTKSPAYRDSHGHGGKRRRDKSKKKNFDSSTSNRGSVSQIGYGNSGNAGETSNPRPSGSGDNQQGRSQQQGDCNQQSSRPQLDLRHLRDQPTSQGSRSHCKSCQHEFETCPYCRHSPPSTPRCHACPDAQNALRMQAGFLHAGQSQGPLPHTSQTIDDVGHAWTSTQAFYDGSSSIHPMTDVNPLLYGALPQGPQQLNMHVLQQAQAHGLHSGIDTPQSPFASDQSWTVGAVYDVQVVGISELEMEPSISDSKKKTQSSDRWSDVLPFRGSSLPACKPHTGVNTATQIFIGPLSLSKVNISSMCQRPRRTRSQDTYFARSRVDIALGRRIEMDFKMASETRGLGLPLRTRIQVVIKVLRLRSSVVKSANGKHKQGANAVPNEALEDPLYSSETKAIDSEEDVQVVDQDNTDYDSDGKSTTDSIFSASSRVSSYNDLTVCSPGPSSPALTSPGIPSCTDMELHALVRPRSPVYWDSDDDTNSDEQLTKVVDPFEEEEKELELTFDLDLQTSLNKLPRWIRVPTGTLSSDLSVQDLDRVFEYFMRYMLFVIVSLARAREYSSNSSLAKKGSPDCYD